MVENQGDRTMIPLKAYLEKKAKDSGYGPGSEIMPTAVGGGLGAIGGGVMAPEIANAIAPGRVPKSRAEIIGALLGAGGLGYGSYKLHKAMGKADKKDERMGLNYPRNTAPKKIVPNAKGRITGQLFTGAATGALGGVGGHMLASELAPLIKSNIAPRNISRAALISTILGAAAGGWGGAKLYAKSHDDYKKSLKKK
jgi:hypothetical protein